MKFYIASSLANHAQVRYLADRLQASGWKHTFDWTAHSAKQPEDSRALARIAEMEYKGVKDADVVIVLTPRGRGTHTELGMAVALGKRVYLCHADDTYFRCDKNTSAFYWLPQVTRFIGSIDEIAEALLRSEEA